MRASRREPFGLGDMPRTDTTAFDLALFSGGDERVFIEPASGRTKYGTPQRPADDEIWFSSSTASAISPRGYAAAATAWQDLVRGRQTLGGCYAGVRQQLLDLFGVEGTQALLAGSGTEAILIATALASMRLGPHVTTILVGAAETGRGVIKAAGGRHFLHHAAFAEVAAGTRIEGLQDIDIQVETIALREHDGALRAMAKIDAELGDKVAAARRAGRNVIIQRLDVSKTGQSAPSLAILEELCAIWPDHILVLADCCQLRSSAEHIKALLARGFLVALTGSKFAAATPFCGGLLIPSAFVETLQKDAVPEGLAAYSAQLDWPAAMRGQISVAALTAANIGLVLRWHAALAEITTFFTQPAILRETIARRFRDLVMAKIHLAQVHQQKRLIFVPTAIADDGNYGQTIVSILMRHSDGRLFSMDEATLAMRQLAGDGIHLGQAVEIGGAGALRLCASMPLINHMCESATTGTPLAEAFAPTASAIDRTLHRWHSLFAA